ncbi:MAG: hypothetical protein K0Q59_2488 [Paenibacillus sp.]|jgi:hypothetical protein|nr:hypothetical protein [Paenibacillus sp.]
MADKEQPKTEKIELNDLAQEATEEQLKDVQGGDFHMGTRVIVKKVQIRP